MSTEYKDAKSVPSNVLIDRLKQLAGAVARHDMSQFDMRVPAEHDRDADLVMSTAADRIAELEKELKSLRETVKAWNAADEKLDQAEITMMNVDTHGLTILQEQRTRQAMLAAASEDGS